MTKSEESVKIGKCLSYNTAQIISMGL